MILWSRKKAIAGEIAPMEEGSGLKPIFGRKAKQDSCLSDSRSVHAIVRTKIRLPRWVESDGRCDGSLQGGWAKRRDCFVQNRRLGFVVFLKFGCVVVLRYSLLRSVRFVGEIGFGTWIQQPVFFPFEKKKKKNSKLWVFLLFLGFCWVECSLLTGFLKKRK